MSEKKHVLVAGGGPAGVAAALAAARYGAKTTLVEYHPVLGGMGTAALVNNFCNAYHDGNRFIIGGIWAELRQELIERGGLYATLCMEPYEPVTYNRILMEKVQEAGIDCIHGHRVASTSQEEDGRVTVELDDGRSILCDGAVDCTGDAVLAHQAGLPTTFGRESDGAVMPLTMCYRITGIDLDEAESGFPHWIDERNGESRPVYTDPNTGEGNFFHSGHSEFIDPFIVKDRASGALSIPRDHVAVIQGVPGCPGDATINYGRVFVDDPTDPEEMKRAVAEGEAQVHDGIEFFRRNLPGFAKVELVEMARQIGVRQSRQLVGEYTLTAQECLDLKQFDDVVVQCKYMIDIHEPGSDKSTCITLPKGEHYDIPWRCLIPKGGQGRLAVAGRCASADAGAMASFRVQPSAMALGEAAGLGVAMAAMEGQHLGQVDVEALQARLLETGGILN